METIAKVRAQAKRLVARHKGQPRALVEEAIRLAGEGDEQLAFEVFRASKAAVRSLTRKEIETLRTHLHDWNSTDCFACFVSGVAWREGVLSDSVIARWARSDDRWTRRAALASTVPLNLPARGATAPEGEPAKTLAICQVLVDDRDDMVVKALSWALRVLARKDASAVRAFIAQHADRLASRVLRETHNTLKTGLKNPKRSLHAPSTRRPAAR
ncbi:MAG: DNA alkylation repair protein [Phycisphaerales bacterium]